MTVNLYIIFTAIQVDVSTVCWLCALQTVIIGYEITWLFITCVDYLRTSTIVSYFEKPENTPSSVIVTVET